MSYLSCVVELTRTIEISDGCRYLAMLMRLLVDEMPVPAPAGPFVSIAYVRTNTSLGFPVPLASLDLYCSLLRCLFTSERTIAL